MRRLSMALALTLAAAALCWATPALACNTDVDCKGDRICVNGACVEPTADQVGPGAAAGSAAPAPAATSPAAAGASRTSAGAAGGGYGWLLNGSTVGAGTHVLYSQLGWPGLELGYLWGMARSMDLGGRFTFIYGLEGTTDIVPGIKLEAIFRLKFLERDRFSLGLRTSPGLLLYFPGNDYLDHLTKHVTFDLLRKDPFITFGLGIPIQAVAGIRLIDTLSLHLGLGPTLSFLFTPEFSVLFPILMNTGLEYKVAPKLSLTFDARMGPTIFALQGGTDVRFSFGVMVGIAFAL